MVIYYTFIILFFNLRWGVLFSHPADYTPVCTTELGAAAKAAGEFAKRKIKMIGFSIDSIEDHNGWIKVNLNLNFKYKLIKY